MTQSQSSAPSGVLYFSNGASIEKLDLKTGKREEIVPWLDHEGKHESNSTFPVYSSREKKMYFFRSYVWPLKRHLVVYDLVHQQVERTIDFWGEALSLSPDENTFAYFKSKRINDSMPSQRLELIIHLVIRTLVSGHEEILASDVCFDCRYTSPPIWLSNEEIIYFNADHEIVQINIHTKVKQKWGNIKIHPLVPSTLSPDRTKLVAGVFGFPPPSKIYLIDVRSRTEELLKISSWLINGDLIWSPDGKSFIYTRFSWSNKLPFNEVGNLYWWDIETKKEVKIANTISLFGGFWLDESEKGTVPGRGTG